MQRILKALLSATAWGMVSSYRRLSLDLLKVRAATAYVQGVQTVRRWWIGAILLAAVLLLLAVGFVLIHVGLFLWVPWALATKAMLLCVLGLVYMGLALIILLHCCAEKTWMRGSHADQLVAKTTHQP